MSRMNPDLIVPIRDRRRGKRILTLKNVRNAALIAIGLFVALTVVSEIRGRKPTADYGRLFGQQVASPPPVPQAAPQVITEAPVDDQEHADPMLLSAAAREQYLGATPMTAPALPTTTEAVQPAPSIGPGMHVTIVGDANGVGFAAAPTEPRGTLGGGIFKPD